LRGARFRIERDGEVLESGLRAGAAAMMAEKMKPCYVTTDFNICD